MEQSVILGSGAAAYEGAKAMREEGYTGDIHVFSDTDAPPYNPMLTTYYACGKLPFTGMFPYGTGKEVWEDLNVTFHGGNPIVSLDAQGRKATAKDGTVFPFDQCLIATGATPVVPPFPGHDSKKLYTVRTVSDAQRLRDVAGTKPRRVIVVGASMVGIKVVELFHKVGSEVCLVDMAPRIFSLAAHPTCAQEIETRLTDKGINLRFGVGLTAIEDTQEGVCIHFGEGVPTEEGDLIVLCIGVRANISAINREEITVDRGILVDQQMRTNVPYIYAAGDVAQGLERLSGKQQIIGLWANARMQGQTAGRNMAGKESVHEGNILHNITHFMGMDFVGLGAITGYTHMEERREGNRLALLFWRDDTLIGANYLDEYLSCGTLRTALTQGTLTTEPGKSSSYIDEYHCLLSQMLEEKGAKAL